MSAIGAFPATAIDCHARLLATIRDRTGSRRRRSFRPTAPSSELVLAAAERVAALAVVVAGSGRGGSRPRHARRKMVGRHYRYSSGWLVALS
jgi:hypothetical protein